MGTGEGGGGERGESGVGGVWSVVCFYLADAFLGTKF